MVKRVLPKNLEVLNIQNNDQLELDFDCNAFYVDFSGDFEGFYVSSIDIIWHRVETIFHGTICPYIKECENLSSDALLAVNVKNFICPKLKYIHPLQIAVVTTSLYNSFLDYVGELDFGKKYDFEIIEWRWKTSCRRKRCLCDHISFLTFSDYNSENEGVQLGYIINIFRKDGMENEDPEKYRIKLDFDPENP